MCTECDQMWSNSTSICIVVYQFLLMTSENCIHAGKMTEIRKNQAPILGKLYKVRNFCLFVVVVLLCCFCLVSCCFWSLIIVFVLLCICIFDLPSVLWHCWLGGRKCIRPVKNWVDGMLKWLCVWVKVQICIWPSWCHCHSLSLAAVNPDWFYLPDFTFLVPAHLGSPGQNPTVVCVCVCSLWHYSWSVLTLNYCVENCDNDDVLCLKLWNMIQINQH